jgi:hypothetical protein
MYFRVREILQEIAKENDLSFEQIKEIFDSEFLCTKKAMGEGIHDEPDTFKNINLIKLGKIYCNTKIVENMKNNKKKKDV